MESGNLERDISPAVSVTEEIVSENKKKQNTCYSPVVMVLQQCTSPKFTTPLRCKDFYSSSSAPVCRICHEEDSPASLISPCNCMGSLGCMHRKCLEKWLSMSNSDRCEICKFRFRVVYRTRHFGQWLLSGGTIGPKGFLGDMICLFVLLPLSMMSVYLCAFGAHNYMYKHEWQATGLALLCLFLLLAFLLWSVLTFRFHYLRFREWQRSNLIIRVVDNPQEYCTESDDCPSNLERNVNSVESMENGRYIPMPESGLSYGFDVTALPLAFSTILVTETRL